MYKSYLQPLIFAILALVLVACSGTSGDESPTSGDQRAAEANRTAELFAKSAAINTAELTKAQSEAAQTAPPEPQVLTKASARSPVYRFYNTQTGAHFYTISVTERDRVKNTLPVFAYEGEAFYVSAVADVGLSPVYRFYNTQTGVHFYSISAEEKTHIEANLPQMKYEGIGYYASKTLLAGMVPLYRFYVSTKGFHFYSASEAEKDRIRTQLPHYLFESVGYYVFGSAVESFAVGGSLSGLAAGQSVVLQNNSGDDLTLSADGSFTFSRRVNKDSVYSVSVKTQPVGQTCAISNPSGTVTAVVASVVVNCSTNNYSVGGSVTGLGAGRSLVLQMNGASDLPLGANGAFVFPSTLSHGTAYSVTVKTQPVGHTCSVANAAGTALSEVGDLLVQCVVNSYPVRVVPVGLPAGQVLVLQNNGADDLTISTSGFNAFSQPVAFGSTYAVTIKSQPVAFTCKVDVGTGTMGVGVVVTLTCTPNSYVIGGSVSGLGTGKSVVLQLNGANDLTRTAAGSFSFAATVAHGSAYSVTVKTQPVGQTCSVGSGSGTATAAVTTVTVNCTTNTYTVGGNVTGLATGQSVVLQINGGGDLVRSANGAFGFSTPLTDGGTYLVSVKTQPVGQTCLVANGSGTVTGAVTNISVTCSTSTYNIGGTVTGLATGQSVVLQLNGANDLVRSASGAFTFAAPVSHGGAYNVTVKTQPAGQTCSVTGGSGTATTAVTTVQVTCSTNAYSVGGSITGLGAGKTVVLQNNAGNDLVRSVNGNFVFSVAIPYGSPYAVSVKTQPVDQTCTVTTGLGTVNGQVSNVAVSCADHVTVSGALSGLIAGNPVVLTLNGGGDLSLSANGGFSFASKTPLGATYVVGVKTQPRGQTCAVGNATGTAVSAVTNIVVSCANNTPTDLVISEVGGCPWESYSGCWLEVFNPTSTTRTLSAYRLRSGESTANVSIFDLPSVAVAPGQYRILAANVSGDVPVTSQNPVVMLGNASSAPFWGGFSGSGLVELVTVTGGTTVDAVRFGNEASAPQPLTAGHWTGAAVSGGFEGGINDQSRSIVRPLASMSSQDTQSALDWAAVAYATPGGPNDVASGATDADNDGLPDANELPGTTYNGLDLYSMGARANQRDIFVEIDRMNISTASVTPQRAAMQRVKDAFALKGIAVHMDAGSLYSTTFDPAQFNLGQSDALVPYQPCVGFLPGDCSGNSSASYRLVYDWKWQHFDPRRRPMFHYALMAERSTSAESGRAEIFGNDILVSIGTFSFLSTQKMEEFQASTLMHELGHNLGLSHGGADDVNYKPNYLSVMNYLFQGNGVSPGNTIWPFVYWKNSFGAGSGNIFCFPGATNPICTAEPVPFAIGYSEGSGLPLNESVLFESANVGRGALPGVYADWDLNGALTGTAISKDLNGDGVLGVLTDHNDWAAITLPFVRMSSGGLLQKAAFQSLARRAAKVPERGPTVPDPLLRDRGPTISTCGGETRNTQTLRTLRGKAAYEQSPASGAR